MSRADDARPSVFACDSCSLLATRMNVSDAETAGQVDPNRPSNDPTRRSWSLEIDTPARGRLAGCGWFAPLETEDPKHERNKPSSPLDQLSGSPVVYRQCSADCHPRDDLRPPGRLEYGVVAHDWRSSVLSWKTDHPPRKKHTGFPSSESPLSCSYRESTKHCQCSRPLWFSREGGIWRKRAMFGHCVHDRGSRATDSVQSSRRRFHRLVERIQSSHGRRTKPGNSGSRAHCQKVLPSCQPLSRAGPRQSVAGRTFPGKLTVP
jgi:hypothetical protein